MKVLHTTPRMSRASRNICPWIAGNVIFVLSLRLNSCLFRQKIFLSSHLGVNSSVMLFRNVVLRHHCEKTRFSVFVTRKSQVTSKMHHVTTSTRELKGKYGAPLYVTWDQVLLSFRILLGMVIYDKEFETKENKIWTQDKIEPQHMQSHYGT